MIEQATKNNERKKIRGVLIDLSGTLHHGNTEIPGARNAVLKLRKVMAQQQQQQFGNITPCLRFLTNTSTKSVKDLLEHLNDPSGLNFGISPEEMVTSLKATADYVKEKNLCPLLLLEDASDFECVGTIERSHDSVVVGLAPSLFSYEHLNKAFRILRKHPENLIAVHRAETVRDPKDGDWSLGPGAFVKALEASANCSPAKVMGKPNQDIFGSALKSMNCLQLDANNDSAAEIISSKDVCMIGDDVVMDCQGALAAGIGMAILVQTGKYREGDETKSQEISKEASSNALVVCLSIVEAIDFVIESLIAL